MKPKTEQPIEIPSNAFMSVLQGHANGEACQELTEGMQACIEAASTSGKPSVMTLKIKFTPASRSGAIIVGAEVSTKLPPTEKPTSIWFADEEYTLHREDPNQKQLPLRTVAGVEVKEVRTVNSN